MAAPPLPPAAFAPVAPAPVAPAPVAPAPVAAAPAPVAPAPAPVAPAPAPVAPTPVALPAPTVLCAPLERIAGAAEVLRELADQPFESGSALKVVKLTRWARAHHARYADALGRAAMQLGENAGNGSFRIPSERLDEFNRMMAPVRAEAVECPRDLRLDISDLAGLRITPAALERLGPLVAGL